LVTPGPDVTFLSGPGVDARSGGEPVRLHRLDDRDRRVHRPCPVRMNVARVWAVTGLGTT